MDSFLKFYLDLLHALYEKHETACITTSPCSDSYTFLSSFFVLTAYHGITDMVGIILKAKKNLKALFVLAKAPVLR